MSRRTILLCLLAASLAGCNGQPASMPRGNVAVIDLDGLAQQIGRDVVMNESIAERERVLNEQLKGIQDSLTKQLTDKQNEFGDAPDDEQTKILLELQQQANFNLNQMRTTARTNLASHRQDLIRKFREETRPIAQQVAKEHGFDVVVTKNDSVLFVFQDEVDITNDVLARLRSNSTSPTGLTATPPAASPDRTATLPSDRR